MGPPQGLVPGSEERYLVITDRAYVFLANIVLIPELVARGHKVVGPHRPDHPRGQQEPRGCPACRPGQEQGREGSERG